MYNARASQTVLRRTVGLRACSEYNPQYYSLLCLGSKSELLKEMLISIMAASDVIGL